MVVYNGKPYEQMDDLGGKKPPYFWIDHLKPFPKFLLRRSQSNWVYMICVSRDSTTSKPPVLRMEAPLFTWKGGCWSPQDGLDKIGFFNRNSYIIYYIYYLYILYINIYIYFYLPVFV